MAKGRQHPHTWPAGAGLALGAAAVVAAFLAPSIPTAFAQSVKEAPSATTASSGCNCSASVDGTGLGRDGWVGDTNAHPSKDDAPANAFDGNSATRFGRRVPVRWSVFPRRSRLGQDVQRAVDERTRVSPLAAPRLRS